MVGYIQLYIQKCMIQKYHNSYMYLFSQIASQCRSSALYRISLFLTVYIESWRILDHCFEMLHQSFCTRVGGCGVWWGGMWGMGVGVGGSILLSPVNGRHDWIDSHNISYSIFHRKRSLLYFLFDLWVNEIHIWNICVHTDLIFLFKHSNTYHLLNIHVYGGSIQIFSQESKSICHQQKLVGVVLTTYISSNIVLGKGHRVFIYARKHPPVSNISWDLDYETISCHMFEQSH